MGLAIMHKIFFAIFKTHSWSIDNPHAVVHYADSFFPSPQVFPFSFFSFCDMIIGGTQGPLLLFFVSDHKITKTKKAKTDGFRIWSQTKQAIVFFAADLVPHLELFQQYAW